MMGCAMKHRSLGSFVLALLLSAACLGQTAPATQPRSSMDYRKDLVEIFQLRMMQHIQLTDQPWAESARRMVQLMAQTLADDRMETMGWPADAPKPAAVAALADELIKAGCDDPNVLFCCMRAYLRAWRDDDARAIALKLRDVPRSRFAAVINFPLVDDLTTLSTDLADWRTLPGRRTTAMRTFAANATTDRRFDGVLLRLVLAYVQENDARYSNLRGDESIAAQTIRQQGVDPWVANVLKGRELIEEGWNVRGTRFAIEVDPAAWPIFGAKLDDATIHLTEAGNRRPNLPEAWTGLITASMGASKPTIPWFEKAIAAELDNRAAWMNTTFAHVPRWGGSHAKALELAQRARATGRYDTLTPYRFVEIAQMVEADRAAFGVADSMWRDRELVDQTVEVLNKYIELAGDSDRAARFLGVLLEHGLATSRYDIARDASVRLARLDAPYRPLMVRHPHDVLLSAPHAYTSDQREAVEEAVRLWGEHDAGRMKVVCEQALAKLPADHPGRLYFQDLLATAEAELGFETGEWVNLTPNEKLMTWRADGGAFRWIDGAMHAACEGEAILLSSRTRFKGSMEFVLKLDVPRPTVDNAAMIGMTLSRRGGARAYVMATATPSHGGLQATISGQPYTRIPGEPHRSVTLTVRIAPTGVTVSNGGDFHPVGNVESANQLLEGYIQPSITQGSFYRTPNMRIIVRDARIRKLPENG